MNIMKEPVNRGAAVELDGLGHFSQTIAKQIRNSLQPVLDGILMKKQHLRSSGNAAVAVQKVNTSRIKEVMIFPVGCKAASGMVRRTAAVSPSSMRLRQEAPAPVPLQEHPFMRENTLGILQIVKC